MKGLVEGLRGIEWVTRDVAMLASQVAGLASLRMSWVAGRHLTTDVRILVG